MPAADDDHWHVAGHFVQIAAEWQALLLELCLVPIAIGDDDVAGLALLYTRFDRGEHFPERPRARQIDPGAAARAVQVVVRQAGGHRETFQIDLPCGWSRELAHVVVGPDR